MSVSNRHSFVGVPSRAGLTLTASSKLREPSYDGVERALTPSCLASTKENTEQVTLLFNRRLFAAVVSLAQDLVAGSEYLHADGSAPGVCWIQWKALADRQLSPHHQLPAMQHSSKPSSVEVLFQRQTHLTPMISFRPHGCERALPVVHWNGRVAELYLPHRP